MLFSLIQQIRFFLTKLKEDSISAFAAQAAFFIILSFFPFVMFLLTLLNYLPVSPEDLRTFASGIFPATVNNILTTIFSELVEKSSRTVLSVTVIAALWSASRGMLALVRGLNAVYGHKETRNYFLIRGISMLYTLGFAALLIITLLLLVFGNQLYKFIIAKLPLLENLALIIMSMRFLVTMAILTVFFLLLYLVIPNRKSTFLRELPGALLTAGGWLGFSFLFSFYIDHMTGYTYTYGSLTTLAVCMLWLYFCMYLLFLGAEINMLFSNDKDT